MELLDQPIYIALPLSRVLPPLQHAIAQQHPQEKAEDQANHAMKSCMDMRCTPLPIPRCSKTYASPYTGGCPDTLPGGMRPRLGMLQNEKALPKLREHNRPLVR